MLLWFYLVATPSWFQTALLGLDGYERVCSFPEPRNTHASKPASVILAAWVESMVLDMEVIVLAWGRSW